LASKYHAEGAWPNGAPSVFEKFKKVFSIFKKYEKNT
jgi:hypothetical protein